MSKVDWTKWSAIAEILSALAIVVTLLYLADQTKQLRAQTEQNNLIALSEGDTSIAASLVALNDQIASHAEIWQKGATQLEELDDVEAVVFEQLVQSASTIFFYEYRRVERIQGEAAAGVTRRTFVAFLQRNPGARSEWLRLNDELQTVREALSPDGENLSEWSSAVIRDLAVMDELGSRN